MKYLLFIPFLFAFLSSAFSQDISVSGGAGISFDIKTEYSPEIKAMKRTDLNFRQLQSSVRENDMRYFSGKETYPEFFVYTCGPKDTLIALASSTGIPYDTLSTINSVPDVSFPLENIQILVPTVKGLFVAEKPLNAVEILLFKEFENQIENAPSYVFKGKKFFFLEGKRFTPYQRLFFLDSGFSLPLDSNSMTSEFGMRKSPVYGTWKQHNGIDFASKVGDKVYACKNGIVSFVKKNDEIFGNYLIIAHSGGMTSVYAHLSKIFVAKGENVRSRQIIGETGESGKVTGPHLHFEIRQGGKATDPKKLLPS